jgi:hypothetical protein
MRQVSAAAEVRRCREFKIGQRFLALAQGAPHDMARGWRWLALRLSATGRKRRFGSPALASTVESEAEIFHASPNLIQSGL